MKYLRSLSNEIVLGTLVALLSVFTALASYQVSTADSKQNEHEILGMQLLNDGNVEAQTATQWIMYDFSLFDGFMTSESESFNEDYYLVNFSDELNNAIVANPDAPFSTEYYDAMYALADEIYAEADANFELADQWDNRGDGLQLVMLIMALGLAFAAWASLLKEESNMRMVFALFALLTLVVGLLTYVGVPTV